MDWKNYTEAKPEENEHVYVKCFYDPEAWRTPVFYRLGCKWVMVIEDGVMIHNAVTVLIEDHDKWAYVSTIQ